MALKAGDKAPDFNLKSKNADGLHDVKLSDNFGKKNTLLLFFPAAFTGVCTDQLCDASNGLGHFSDQNTEVYGISVDSPFAQEAWAKANNINVTLLSDYGRDAVEKYGTGVDFLGMGLGSRRAAFVVDKEGNVQYAEITNELTDLPNQDEINKVLGSLS